MVWDCLRYEKGGRSDDVTRYRVRKCMQELGIRGITPNARKQTTIPDKDAAKRPDLLRRDLASPVPTHELVGDTAYPDTPDGLVCLATAGDLAARMVVGWAIADNMRAQLVVDALAMAYGRGYVAENAIFHSDYAAESARPQSGTKPQTATVLGFLFAALRCGTRPPQTRGSPGATSACLARARARRCACLRMRDSGPCPSPCRARRRGPARRSSPRDAKPHPRRTPAGLPAATPQTAA